MIDTTTLDFWLGQGKYPWKEEGYGGGKQGYTAWSGADYPNINKYLPQDSTPEYGGDVVLNPPPSPPSLGGDVNINPAYPQFTTGTEYGTPDYWGSQGMFPWKDMGYGGGIEGIRAWQAAGSPLPPGYPTGGGGGGGGTPGGGPPPSGGLPPEIPTIPGWDLPPAGAGAPGTITGGYPPVETAFPYPSQWGIASNVMQRFAEGLPTQLPEFWQQGANQALQMAQTGRPTPVPPEWGETAGLARQAMQTGLPTPTPDIWKTGGQLATQMAQTGMPVPAPQEWNTASQAAQQMLTQQGMPVDVGGWWEAQQPVYERAIREQSQQAAEEAGLAGLRWSTPLQRNIADITRKASENLWADLAGREIGAQESARGRMMETVPQLYGIGAGMAGLGEAARARQMGALPQMYQYGAGTAGLAEAARQRQLTGAGLLQNIGTGTAGLGEAAAQRAAGAIPNLYQYAQLPTQLAEAAKNRGLTAAGGLMDIGQAYTQLPMQVAQQSMNMGLSMQQAQQNQINRQLAEFLRMTPEASPWLTLAMQGTAMPFQQVPQQYQPSFMSQLLNMGGAVTSAAGAAGGFPALFSSAQYKKDISQIDSHSESKISTQMLNTPLFSYRYKFEDDSITPHLGIITETSPKEVTLFNQNAVGLYEYISALHATIKELDRRIKRLEN